MIENKITTMNARVVASPPKTKRANQVIESIKEI